MSRYRSMICKLIGLLAPQLALMAPVITNPIKLQITIKNKTKIKSKLKGMSHSCSSNCAAL